MNAADSQFYPDTGLRGATPTRDVTVYMPSQYVPGTAAPLIVSCDAYGARNNQLPNILDNMIADGRLPPIVAVMIANGGGDGARQRARVSSTTRSSGKYAEFVEAEVLPKVEQDYGVTITKDPDARMTLGGSSGGSAAFNMAWFHPELYRRVLIYSGTFVNQHPDEALSARRVGVPRAHHPADAPAKPIRIWMHVSQNDNGAQRRLGRPAQLGDRQHPHGRRAEGQGLSLPVRLRERRRAHRRQGHCADLSRSTRIRLAGLYAKAVEHAAATCSRLRVRPTGDVRRWRLDLDDLDQPRKTVDAGQSNGSVSATPSATAQSDAPSATVWADPRRSSQLSRAPQMPASNPSPRARRYSTSPQR